MNRLIQTTFPQDNLSSSRWRLSHRIKASIFNGRAWFATKHIKEGDVVFSELPLISSQLVLSKVRFISLESKPLFQMKLTIAFGIGICACMYNMSDILEFTFEKSFALFPNQCDTASSQTVSASVQLPSYGRIEASFLLSRVFGSYLYGFLSIDWRTSPS